MELCEIYRVEYIAGVDELMPPSRIVTHMQEQPLYLWCAYPEDASNEAVVQWRTTLLSEEEWTRSQTFRFDRHRREYLTTRALARIALSHYCSVAPEAWHFELNTYGKPSVSPNCGLRFNLSNCPGLVVCLIAQGAEVGVDAEPYERAGKIAELGATIFSPQEINQLAALRDAERLDRALSLWTLKEAYIKVRGKGLTLPLNKISFVFGGGIHLQLDRRVDDEPRQSLRFSLLDHASHRIALMTELTVDPKLQLWETRPILAPALKVPVDDVHWYRFSQGNRKCVGGTDALRG